MDNGCRDGDSCLVENGRDDAGDAIIVLVKALVIPICIMRRVSDN